MHFAGFEASIFAGEVVEIEADMVVATKLFRIEIAAAFMIGDGFGDAPALAVECPFAVACGQRIVLSKKRGEHALVRAGFVFAAPEAFDASEEAFAFGMAIGA